MSDQFSLNLVICSIKMFLAKGLSRKCILFALLFFLMLKVWIFSWILNAVILESL